MEREQYLQLIEDRLQQYFDMERNHEYQQMDFDLYAKSKIRSERYFASKKLKVYAMENHEHVFVKEIAALTESELNEYWNILLKAAEEKVNPHDEHMSTIITGVIVTGTDPNENLIRQIEKMKYNKSFAFGLKGWVYIRLVAVNIATGSVYFNKRGKEVQEVYTPVLST